LDAMYSGSEGGRPPRTRTVHLTPDYAGKNDTISTGYNAYQR
jgi:hypothetical protein